MSDFDDYVAARGPALLALAVLVAGQEAEARRHVAGALGRALPRWDTLVHREDPDAALRRDLIAALGRRRLHRARDDATAWQSPAQDEPEWQEWLALPRLTRALLALRYVEHRSWVELAWLTDLPVRAVRQRVERGRGRLGPEDRLSVMLQGWVESLDTWPLELSRQAARTGLRRRERQVRGAVAAGLALVVTVPVGLAIVPGVLGDVGDLSPAPVPDTSTPDSVLPAGWRAETWRGVEVGVPDDWGHVSLSTWCSVRDEGAMPRVERPGRYPALDCRPPLGPGLHFRTVGDPDPEVSSGLATDEVRVGSVVVLVATEDEDLTERVLSTARLVERLDAAGCEVQRPVPRAGRTFPPADPGRTAMSVCRYAVGISGPNLVQSERLSILDSAEALRAIREAPTVTAVRSCLDGPGEEVVLFASAEGDVAWLHLGRCQGMDDDGTHLLTEDVLYWALSPGWNGDRGDLPLPDRLREAVRT